MSGELPNSGNFSMDVPQYQLELDNQTFKDFAFNTHPLAYLDGGLAHLPPMDLIEITAQPRMQEWGSWGTYVQVAESGWGAVKTWGGEVGDAISSKTNDLVSRALNFLTTK